MINLPDGYGLVFFIAAVVIPVLVALWVWFDDVIEKFIKNYNKKVKKNGTQTTEYANMEVEVHDDRTKEKRDFP